MMKLIGHNAIAAAKRNGGRLSKFGGAPDMLSVEEAEAIAEVDPSLVYLEVDEGEATATGSRYYEVSGERFADLQDAIARAGALARAKLARRRTAEINGSDTVEARIVSESAVNVYRDDGTIAANVSP